MSERAQVCKSIRLGHIRSHVCRKLLIYCAAITCA
jgi:hypothetical protein